MNRWTHPAIHGAFNDGGQNSPPETPRAAHSAGEGPPGTEGRGEGSDAADGSAVTYPLRTRQVGTSTIALEPDVQRLTDERDRAREECGHEKAMRRHIRDELHNWIGLKRTAEAERDRARQLAADLEAENARLTEALARVRALAVEWAAPDRAPIVNLLAKELRAALDGADS